jgi:hypothetical protein
MEVAVLAELRWAMHYKNSTGSSRGHRLNTQSKPRNQFSSATTIVAVIERSDWLGLRMPAQKESSCRHLPTAALPSALLRVHHRIAIAFLANDSPAIASHDKHRRCRFQRGGAATI